MYQAWKSISVKENIKRIRMKGNASSSVNIYIGSVCSAYNTFTSYCYIKVLCKKNMMRSVLCLDKALSIGRDTNL